MPVSYAKLFDLMNQQGIKKVDLRKTYKINPKTVDSLVNNRSVTVDTIMQLRAIPSMADLDDKLARHPERSRRVCLFGR